MVTRVSLLVSLLTVSCSAAWAMVVHVDVDSTASPPDGLSWATAYPSIQQAIDAAVAGGASASNPAEVWVAEGTYTGTADPVVTLHGGVHLYGGFSGTETARALRDWKLHETVIDGESARRCVVGATLSTLDSFTVRGGSASSGAGMLNDGCSPNVAHCLFRDNAATDAGGAMANTNSSLPQVIECVFLKNTAGFYGGGLSNSSSSALVEGCKFLHNTADSYGGGLYNESCSPNIIRCEFASNTADDNGGAVYSSSASPEFTNCVFVGNRAGYGGGIANSSSSPTLTNCTLAENVAAVDGGGVYDWNSVLTVVNSILWDNMPNQVNHQSAVITYSCIQAGYPGEGNFGADPVFVRTACGNLQLRADSPCLNVGTAEGAPADDLFGLTRPQGPGVDLGAYEYADSDGDGLSDGWEIQHGLDANDDGTTDPLNGPSGDPDGDGLTNLDEYEVNSDPQSQSVFRVDADSTASSPDGASWATAYPAIQSAIDAALADAASAVNPAEVWVAEGTYTGTADPVVTLHGGVHLYGGFSGTETARALRDWKLHETVIDGESARRCVMGASLSTLDGFTVQGGSASRGAGMFNDTCSPYVAHCLFRDNAATTDSGGGMANENSSYPDVIECVFVENSTTRHGGGINNSLSTPFIQDCTFINNSATWGGGIVTYGSSTSIVRCEFIANTAGLKGGAIYSVSSPELVNCVFIENQASEGGCIYNESFSPTINNCTIANNVATNDGGAIFDNSTTEFSTVTNSILWANVPNQFNHQSATVTYSCIQGGYPGEGNFGAEVEVPLFANLAGRDCHLQSTGGRWDPAALSGMGDWVYDLEDSVCIDAGDPMADYSLEPLPNGERINVGAYGATGQASRSPQATGTPLSLNSPLAGTIDTNQMDFYTVTVDAGENLLVRVDTDAPEAFVRLYAKFEGNPAQYSNDFHCVQMFGPDPEMVIPNTQAGTYYILVFGAWVPDGPVPYTIVAEYVDLYVGNISPAEAGNAGETTFELTGAGFNESLTARLISPSSAVVAGADLCVADTTRLSVTFDLDGAEPGQYDLVLQRPNEASWTLPEAIQVSAGVGPLLDARLEVPPVVRADREFTAILEIKNVGDSNAPLPLLLVEFTNASSVKLDSEGLDLGPRVSLVVPSKAQPHTAYPPGESIRIPFCVTAPGGTVEAKVSMTTLTDPELAMFAIDYDSITRPANIEPAQWEQCLARLRTQFGDNCLQYFAVQASYLSIMRDYDFSYYSSVANVNGLWRFIPRETAHYVPIPPVVEVPELRKRYAQMEEQAKAHLTYNSQPPDGNPETYVVIITVEDYAVLRQYEAALGIPEENQSKDLPTRIDAQIIYEYYRSYVNASLIVTRHDGPGSDDDLGFMAVLGAIDEISGFVDGDDTVEVIYSGHGCVNGYWALNTGYISGEVLGQKLDSLGAGLIAVTSDSCYSESFLKAVEATCSTPFVGFASTDADSMSFATVYGSIFTSAYFNYLINHGYSRQEAMDEATRIITELFQNRVDPKERQEPVLINNDGINISGPSSGQLVADKATESLGEDFAELLDSKSIQVIASASPEIKHGPIGIGPQGYVSKDDTFTYTIDFWNKPTATAPVQEAIIIDYLDSDLDWATFRLDEFYFPGHLVPVTEDTDHYYQRVPFGELAVDVQGEIDYDSGRIEWRFTTVDPATDDFPADPYAGFLLPDDPPGSQVGHVTFTVNPRATCTPGTVITNYASVIFDTNPANDTNTVSNTIADLAPDAPAFPIPADGAQRAARDTTLNWADCLHAVKYDVDFGDSSSPPQYLQEQAFSAAQLGALEYGTTYYWQVIAENSTLGTTAGPVWSFTTKTEWEEWIDQFEGIQLEDRDREDDPDADGLTNEQEHDSGTYPNDPDCDDDMLLDGEEVMLYLTDPQDEDTDDDGVTDGEEIANGTDPNDPLSPAPVPATDKIGLVILFSVLLSLFMLRRKLAPGNQENGAGESENRKQTTA